MDYTSTLETLEGLSSALARHCTQQVGAWAILYHFVKVSSTGNCSLYSKRRVVHCQSSIKHAMKMDYTSTLQTLEDFWMTLSWCSEHHFRAWAILYPLIKVSSPWNCSW